MRKHFSLTLLVWLALAAVVASCGGPPSAAATAGPATISTPALASAPEGPEPTEETEAETPAVAVPGAGVPHATEVALDPTEVPGPAVTANSGGPSAGAPRFSHPLEITNPLYPVALIGRSISLGTDAGKPAREEVTLLPGTESIRWGDQPVEARVAQFVGYTDGKLVEVAYDYFAQADDGGVYYLGEDVSVYAAGEVVSHSGSWRAGKDGAPPALIMPAQPRVGQVFNPENLPTVAYETDEIVSLTEKTATPAGPIDTGVLIKEVLMDGSIEYKVNAAAFGIVETRAANEKLRLVWLNRTDAKPGIVPEALAAIEVQAEDIFDVAPGGHWTTVTADVAAVAKAWQAYQVTAAQDQAPAAFQEALSGALDRLQKMSGARDAAGTLRAANDLSAAVVDLSTVYRPALPTDLGLLDVLERQVGLDLAAKDFAAVADTLAKTGAVWARLKPLILARQGASTVAKQFDANLAAQQAALQTKNSPALTTTVDAGLQLVDALEGLY